VLVVSGFLVSSERAVGLRFVLVFFVVVRVERLCGADLPRCREPVV
jgi:hypothetical protein